MMNFLEFSAELIMPIIIAFIFLFIGIGLLYFQRKDYNRRKKRYTIPVEATIIGHDKIYSDHKYLYANIYSYYYNGVEYEIIDSAYTNFAAKEVGTKVQLIINPNNPQEFQSTIKSSSNGTITMGIVFTLMSLLVLISIISEIFS